MQVQVRLFALQREQLGRRQLTLELPGSATIRDAWAALCSSYPILAAAGASMRFARNGVYADPQDELSEGDELALIPPVAGGADPRGPATPGALPRATDARDADAPAVRRIELVERPIDEALLAELQATVASDADGAVVTFLGRTRETPGTPAPGQEAEAERHAGQRVIGLEYEAYESMALATLEAIADEIAERFDVRRLAIVHRLGPVGVGQASVAIACASPHRGPAFEACRYAIEELKARAPIWKSERFADGSVWLGAPARSGPPGVPARSGPPGAPARSGPPGVPARSGPPGAPARSGAPAPDEEAR